MSKYRAFRSRGQTAVLIALMAVALVAFIALAVDGGNAYFTRREAQSAADGASMAGAYVALDYKGGSPVADILRAVNAYAETNGVPDTDGIPGNAINDNVLVYYTDINGDRLQWGGNDWELHPPRPQIIPNGAQGVDVALTISRTTFFARAIGVNTISANANATALWINSSPGGGEYAIFAGAPGCNNTLDVSGSECNVDGKLHSNWNIHFGVDPTGYGMEITYVNDCSGKKDGCDIAEQVPPQPWPVYYDMEDYAPGGRAAVEAAAKGEYYEYNGTDVTNVNQNGLYYVYNGGQVKLTHFGSEIISATLVVREHSKSKGLAFSTNTHLRPYVDGLLIFTDMGINDPKCTTAVVNFSNSAHDWGGVMFAPYGLCDMSGANNSTFYGGIFCYTIKLSGSSISIAYDSSYFPDIPPQIRLFK